MSITVEAAAAPRWYPNSNTLLLHLPDFEEGLKYTVADCPLSASRYQVRREVCDLMSPLV